MINLKQFQYVLVLSQEGSFSRAADILNISQPSLSQYIKKIEKQLGTELFVRTNGEVRLTDAGELYLDAGKRILALEHQMENKLTDIASYRCGTISVGISPYRSIHMIPKVFAEFDRMYPGLKLLIKEKSGTNLIESAKRGEFDICVIALPVDKNIFDYEVIQKEEIVIAVHSDTPFCSLLQDNAEMIDNRKFPSVDIKLADGQNFAVLNDCMLMRTVTDRLLEKNNVCIHEKIELSSNEALLSIVESSACASFIPSGLTDLSTNAIKFFSIKQEFEFRNIAVIWKKDQYLSKPITDLIKILKSVS